MARVRAVRVFLSYAFKPWQKAYKAPEIRAMLERAVEDAGKRPGLAGRGVKLVPDYAMEPGRILRDEIHRKIRASDVAVVDISDNNPNVLYELGYMDALGKYPPILLKSNREKEKYEVPSDINNKIYLPYDHIDDMETPLADALEKQVTGILDAPPGPNEVRMLWYGKEARTVHVIAPRSQQETEFARTESPNYDRFHKFGDKTAVWETLVLLARLYPGADVRVHVADEFDMESEMRRDNLVVIGGPGFGNDGNRVCRTISQRMKSRVSYARDYETMLVGEGRLRATYKGRRMTQDYGYFARLSNPYNPDSAIVLVHGIHTLGVLGAARAFSDDAACRDNIEWALGELGSDPHFESWFPVGVADGVADTPVMSAANLSRISGRAGPPRHPLHKSGMIPSQNRMMYPLLELCSGGNAKTVDELETELSKWLGLSPKQRQILTKGGWHTRVKSNMGWALAYLYKADLLDRDRYKGKDKYSRVRYTITERGERIVADQSISELSLTYLRRNFPVRKRRKGGRDKHA